MKNKNKLKLIFIILCILAVIPSIIYLITGNRIFDLVSDYDFFYGMEIPAGKILGSIFFVGIFSGMFITYFMILKYNKEIFKTTKELMKFVIIVSIIFLLILPITSTDIFYYIGTRVE